MYKLYYIILMLIFWSPGMPGQDINILLEQVSNNHPELQAYQKLLEARRFEARTDLTPSDPFVSFGYMPGNTDAIGIKKTWSVNQSFSFPTKYLMQNRISKSNILLAELEFEHIRINTLLNAKLTFLDLIYKEKVLTMYFARKEDYGKLKSAWEKMLKYGQANLLEYNKISMELSSLNLQITRTEADVNMLKSKIHFMNGNNPIKLNAEYPLFSVQDSETMISYKVAHHPAYIIPKQEYLLSIEEIKLSKTGWMPEIQVGYSSEIIPGETYSGPVAGLTIPLWANNNKVKTASAISDHYAAKRDAELSRLKSEFLNNYSSMKALQLSMLEISSLLTSGENKKFLDIALQNGEISLTTYFSNLEIMYQIEEKLLEIENEYNKSVASLLDHELMQ